MSATDGTDESFTAAGRGGDDFAKRRPRKFENLDRKAFVGGISWECTDQDLTEYFSQFGEVTHVQIKYDQASGRSRGFAFIEFADPETCEKVLNQKQHEIKGKTAEVKRAVARENRKVFVGGISNDLSEANIRAYFSTFGEVDEVELPVDPKTTRRRNFAFLVFKDEAGAERACEQRKHLLGDRYCDVKVFTPEARKPQNAMAGYPYGGMGQDYQAAGYGDYNQYWQQYWQYYYGQYYNQYAAAAGGYGQQGQQQPAAAQQAAWNQYSNYANWPGYGAQQNAYANQNSGQNS